LNTEIDKSRDSITKLVKKLGATGEEEINRREQDLQNREAAIAERKRILNEKKQAIA
jgi:hypothetical protein